MSYLVYNENEFRTGAGIPHGLNPNRMFRKHLENWFFLKLTLKNGNIVDRHMASKELAICDRKLEYWQRKRNFCQQQADKDTAELRSLWNPSLS